MSETNTTFKRIDIADGIWAVKGYKDVEKDTPEDEAAKICPDDDDTTDDFDDCEGLVFVMIPYNSGQVVFTADRLKFIASGGDVSSMPLVNDADFSGLDDFDKIIVGLSND